MKQIICGVLLLVPSIVPAEDVVSLDPESAVQMALETSPRSAAATSRIAAARSRRKAADARRFPVIAVHAAAARRNSVPELVLPAAISGLGDVVLFPDIESSYRAGLTLDQPIFTGGAISGVRSATKHEEGATVAEASRTEADLRLEARSAYWAVIATDAVLEATRTEIERAERLLDDARALLSAGMALEADVLGAEARLAAARLRAIDAEAESANRLAALRSLLDVPASTVLELVDRGESLPGRPAPERALVVRAISERSEIQALSFRLDALGSRRATAAAANRPQLSLAAGWETARPNERFLPLEDEWNSSWMVGLVAGWQFFDGNRTASELAGLDAEEAALEAELREVERLIELEVVETRRTLVAALEADAAAAAAVAVATLREEDSAERYAAGLTTVAEVLDAQSELAEAESALALARSRAWLADSRMLRALGQ
jgi:outer membrane protein TolC